MHLNRHQRDKNYLKGPNQVHFFRLAQVQSANMERSGFMPCTAASHHGAIKIFFFTFKSCHAAHSPSMVSKLSPLAPRLEANTPVDVGGIAFPIRYPARPDDFICAQCP